MTCKIRIYPRLEKVSLESGGEPQELKAVDYTCTEVRQNFSEWKSEWRKKNRTDEILARGRRDMAYERYCESIEELLEKCKCQVDE